MRGARHLPIQPQTSPRIEFTPLAGSAGAHLAGQAGADLTPRDLALLALLHRHRVLTALHVARLLYGSYSHARSRLATLTRRGVLGRFRADIWPGAQPWRYTLGPLGAIKHAAATGAELPRPAAVADAVVALAHSRHTNHRLGVNDFFATLSGHTYGTAGQHEELTEWWPENQVAEICAGIIRPDAYGEYAYGASRLQFFFEYDTGTETVETLVQKIEKYRQLADAGLSRTILMRLPNRSREHHLRAALEKHYRSGPPVPLATMAADQLADSGTGIAPARPCVADTVWSAPHHGPARVSLAELVSGPHAPKSSGRATRATTPTRGPR